MPRLTESPSPVPPVARFVVKNGSKIRSSDGRLDARPVVADTRDHRVAVLADIDEDGAAVRHRLARVRDQVEEDLLQLVGAGGHRRA